MLCMDPGTERANRREEINITNDSQQVFREVGRSLICKHLCFIPLASLSLDQRWNLLGGNVLASPASPKQDAEGKALPPCQAPAAVKTEPCSIF